MTDPEGNNKLCVSSTLQHILRELCLFPLGPGYLGGVGGDTTVYGLYRDVPL